LLSKKTLFDFDLIIIIVVVVDDDDVKLTATTLLNVTIGMNDLLYMVADCQPVNQTIGRPTEDQRQ